MTMTKQDFELIANVLQAYTGTSEGQSIAVAFASALKKTNPRFDVQRFLEACGIYHYDSSWMEGKEKA